jgi:hypothetical protein
MATGALVLNLLLKHPPFYNMATSAPVLKFAIFELTPFRNMATSELFLN